MSIILQGFGVDVDSLSSIVAFGLTVDPQTEEEAVEAIQGASIEQLFVVDYGGHRRKASQSEFRRFKRLSRRIDRDNLYFRQRKGRRPGDIRTEWYVKPLPRFRKAA